MKMFRISAGMLAALLISIVPVSAIIWAGPDGIQHPYVGIALFTVNGKVSHLCSGTLLSPTVFLTAGHCTDGTDSARVSFDAAISGTSTWRHGATFTHPDYNTGFPNTRDVGVIELHSPVTLTQYGVLPSLGALDGMAQNRGLSNQLFTIVGYGDQAIVPSPRWAPVRYYGTPQLVELDSAWTGGFNIHLSGNAGQRAPGGACFGDSGGPALLGNSNIVAGVGSFVLNPTCTGASFYYRVDTSVAQDFITPFLN